MKNKHKSKSIKTKSSKNKKNLDLSLKITLATLIGLAILLFTVIIVTFAILNSNKKDATETSERVINQLQAKNVEGFAQLGSSSFKEEVPQDKIDGFLTKMAPYVQGEEELVEAKIGSINKTTYSVTIHKVKVEEQDIFIKTTLVKESNQWKLLSIGISSDKPELKFR